MPVWMRQVLRDYGLPIGCVAVLLFPFVFGRGIGLPILGGTLQAAFYGDLFHAKSRALVPLVWAFIAAWPAGYLTHLWVPYIVRHLRVGRTLPRSRRQQKAANAAHLAAGGTGPTPPPPLATFPRPWEEAAVWFVARRRLFWPVVYTCLTVFAAIIAVLGDIRF